MRRGAFPTAGETDAEALCGAYRDHLAEVVSSRGVEAVAAETGIDDGRVRAIADGDADLTLSEAGSVLATTEDRDGEALAAEARDLLLMGMTSAVLDVDRVASGIDGAMDAKAIQQKLEGRRAMTLAEYATLHDFIAAEAP